MIPGLALIGLLTVLGGTVAPDARLDDPQVIVRPLLPVVSSMSPTTGPVGTTVTITGVDFGTSQENFTLTFNGTPVIATSWTMTQIIANVPGGATTGPVVITVGGKVAQAGTFTVTGGGTTFAGFSCTTTTADANYATVQNAVNAATSGDTICVTVSAPVTWNTQLTISGKALVLVGSTTSNAITLTPASGNGIAVTPSSTNIVRLSNFAFTMGTTAYAQSMIFVNGTIFATDSFRLDNLVISDGGLSGSRPWEVWGSFGLVDHLVSSRVGGQSFDVYGGPEGSDLGYTSWTHPWAPGTNQAVIVEDSLFTKTGNFETIDQYAGARLVFRFNTADGESIGRHGRDSGGRTSAMGDEQLNNLFQRSYAGSQRSDQIRGGSQIKVGNVYTGNYSGMEIYYARTSNSQFSDPGMFGWNYCDGTKYDLVSALNATTTFGTQSRYRNTDNETTCSGAVTGTCVNPFDTGANVGSSPPYGYPCRDAPGRTGGGQILTPMVQVNNSLGGGVWTYNVDGNRCTIPDPNNCGTGSQACCAPLLAAGTVPFSFWIAENREYYQGDTTANTCVTPGVTCTPFTGAATTGHGAGWGILNNRPNTCAVGTYYWAVDQGSWNISTTNPRGIQKNGQSGLLYKCTSLNTWTVNYTPQQYPSPKQYWYWTTFPLTENPISENNAWAHLDPTLTKVQTEVIGGVHVAHGTQSITTCPGWGTGSNCFDDASAYLSGFPLNQQIECTVWKAATVTGVPEVELLLRWSDNNTPHSSPFGPTAAEGWEINVGSTGGFANIGRFKELPALQSVTPSFTPTTGDIFKVTVQTVTGGAQITAYWNGTQFMQVTDPSPYTKGNPGIGFYVDPNVANNQFGFSRCKASGF